MRGKAFTAGIVFLTPEVLFEGASIANADATLSR